METGRELGHEYEKGIRGRDKRRGEKLKGTVAPSGAHGFATGVNKGPGTGDSTASCMLLGVAPMAHAPYAQSTSLECE